MKRPTRQEIWKISDGWCREYTRVRNHHNKDMTNATKLLCQYENMLKTECVLHESACRMWDDTTEELERATNVNETFSSLLDVQDAEILRLVGEYERATDKHRVTLVTLGGAIACLVLMILGMIAVM